MYGLVIFMRYFLKENNLSVKCIVAIFMRYFLKENNLGSGWVSNNIIYKINNKLK